MKRTRKTIHLVLLRTSLRDVPFAAHSTKRAAQKHADEANSLLDGYYRTMPIPFYGSKP